MKCEVASDMDGQAMWIRVVKAVDELMSGERLEGAEVH